MIKLIALFTVLYAFTFSQNHLLDFNGTTSDFVKIENVNNFPSTEITVELWVNSANTSKDGTPFSYAADTDNEFLLYNIKNLAVYINIG